MKQPIEPKREDCCNNGCNPCIFDVYEQQMRQYQLYIESGEFSKSLSENAISQLEYSSFHVVKNIDVCKQHKLLLFKKDESSKDKHVFWSPGEHFLLKFSLLNYSCTRAYTPIKIELQEDYDFAIIVKRYVNGPVSGYLHDLNVGECTMWRGPYGHYKIDATSFKRIVMVAQGTGIAPLFSVIKHILNDEDNMMRLILLYCCKCIDTILLRDELYALKSYWNFEYVIHLGNKAGKNLFKYKEPISIDKLTFKDVLNLKPFTETDQILLCGSGEFIKYYRTHLLEANVQSENIISF